EQSELRIMVKRLFAGPSAKAHFVEDEKQPLRQELVRLLPPDMSLNVSVPEIGFVHRRTSDSDIYFVANTSNARQTVKATFRVTHMQPEWWDPFSGKVAPAKVENTTEAGTTIQLSLEPYASRVLVFSKRALAQQTSSTSPTPAQTPIDISTGWRVTFGANTNPVMMDRLHSWTDDEDTRFFSGTATYEKEVMVPGSFLRSGLTVNLDVGEGKALPEQNLRSGMQTWFEAAIREAAVIYVNEQRAGSLWCPPYALDVTNELRPGRNK